MSGPSRETLRNPAGASETAARVADLLLAFTDERSLGISEAARQTAVSKATCHRMARALVSRGLLDQDPASRKYTLGPAALALGGAAVRRSELLASALPIMQSLQESTRETATISLLVGTKRMYLDQIISPQEVVMTVQVGKLYPLHAGASSKAILALAPPGLREAVLHGPLEPVTGLTIGDPLALRADLELIRDRGYAVSLGERQEGAGSVAAPILGIHGFAIGSLSVCGPVGRFDRAKIEQLAGAVMSAAGELSRRIGSGPRSAGEVTDGG